MPEFNFADKQNVFFFAGIKFHRSKVLQKFANSQFLKNFTSMFGADFNYMTLTKKAKSHKNVLYLVFPCNTNNSIYITDDIDNESGYLLNKWKIRN